MNNAQAVFCTDQTKLCLLHDPDYHHDNQHHHCHCSGHVLHRPDPAQLWLGLTLCPGLSIRATSGHVYGDDHHAHHHDDDDGFLDYHDVNGVQASLSEQPQVMFMVMIITLIIMMMMMVFLIIMMSMVSRPLYQSNLRSCLWWWSPRSSWWWWFSWLS